jgi:hypothetical protein
MSTYKKGDFVVGSDGKTYRYTISHKPHILENPCDYCEGRPLCEGVIADHCSDQDKVDEEDTLVQIGYWLIVDPLYLDLLKIKEDDNGVNNTKRAEGLEAHKE